MFLRSRELSYALWGTGDGLGARRTVPAASGARAMRHDPLARGGLKRT